MNASATQLLDEYTDFQLRRDSFQTRPEKEYDWDNSIVPITQEDMVVRKRGGLKQAYCVFCYHGVQMLRPDVRARLALCGCVAVWLWLCGCMRLCARADRAVASRQFLRRTPRC